MAEYALGVPPFDGVFRAADGAAIPNDAGNADWRAYQAWLADGGVPDPYKPLMPGSQYSWGPTLVEIIGQG